MIIKQLIYGFLGILIGIGGGYMLFGYDSPVSAPAANDMAQTSHSETSMHTQTEVDTTKPIPSISIESTPDSKDGYNLNFVTLDFTLTPENVGGAVEPNTGHMHLYVNGEKIARPYGSWFHLSNSHLKDGDNTIEVTLNANDHSEWVVDGEHISAQITLSK
jgi:hypothetical protein